MKISDGLFSQAVHGVRWIGITKGLSQLLMWIVTIYVVRLLKPEDYGIMAMAGIPTELASLLLDAGLGAALVQRQDVTTSVYRSANTALVLSACMVIGVIQVLAWPLSRFFSEPLLDPVLRVVSLQFLIRALAVVPMSILMKQMRFKELGISGALSGVGGSLVTLGIAFQGYGVWALVLGLLAQAFIFLLLLGAYAGRPVGFSLEFSALRSYVAYSVNLVAQRVVWFYVEQVDLLIIGRVLGTSALGRYSVARQLSHIPLERTAAVINQVTLPAFAAVQGQKERWHSAVKKMLRLASVVSYPIFFGMAAVAPVALPLLLGERWEGAVWPFIFLCIALPLRAADALLTTVLFGLGRADVALKTVLVWAAVLTPMFLLGLQFGVTGIAAAWAIGFPLVYLLASRLVSSSLSIPLADFWIPMLVPATSAIGCVGAVLAVYQLSVQALPPILILPLEIIAGAATYVFLLRTLSRPIFDEVLDLFRRLAGRRQAA